MILFQIINIFLILLYHFSIVEGIWRLNSPRDSFSESNDESNNNNDHQLLPTNLQLRIINKISISSSKKVNLRLMTRSLANKNLPIWIMNGEINKNNLNNNDDLTRNYEVMKQVGKFSIYQQRETSSAAVYFHRRREFDGMIGTQIAIRGLSIQYINPEGITHLKLGKHGIYHNPKYMGHPSTVGDDVTNTDPESMFYRKTNMKTYHSRLYDGYPELLVIVCWDVIQHWTPKTLNDMDLYTKIVSYVITLFNGADMLYSKLEETRIQLNIAGIIIGANEESFFFLDDCYSLVNNPDGSKAEALDANCAMNQMILYLKARKNIIENQSYDYFILLTSTILIRDHEDNINSNGDRLVRIIEGLADEHSNIYMHRKQNSEIYLSAVIQEVGYYGRFATLAHEIGHLMSAYHDEGPFFINDGTCCGYIMKPNSKTCDNCLTWSSLSEQIFVSFFSSPSCCMLINKPRSLFPPGRYQILSSDKQCQCYGYPSARRFTDLFHKFCKSPLECEGSDSKFHSTLISMDGTPCQHDKVCAQKKCQRTAVFAHD